MEPILETDELRPLIEVEKEVLMWGQPIRITPLLVDEVLGDGKQLIGLAPLMTRPNYYVLRVDAGWDLDNLIGDDDEGDHLEAIYETIEAEFGNEHDEETGEERGWPALVSGGSTWFALDWPPSPA